MSSAFNRVGIITTRVDNPAVQSCRQELRAWLTKRGVEILDSHESSIESVIQSADLLVSLGGDGTILRLAGKMLDRLVPVLAVNLGSLGFLTEVKADEMFDELKSIFLGHFKVEERLMLSCTVRSEKVGGPSRRFQALNDFVVNREGLTRYMQIHYKLNNESVTRFFGDGIIVATPTGSTAYSLSAGGPIVHPQLSDIIVTPICPHASALRSVIVPSDKKIEIRIICDREQEKALLTADGQENLEIDDHCVVEITAAQNRFPVIKSSKRSYFGTLREKFKFPM